MTRSGHPLVGWTPTRMIWDGDRPVIRWCFTEGIDFTDPFFHQTIDRCLRDPFRLLFWRETGLDALAELANASPGLEPSGFIFHLSRCGSTLLAQMFARLSSTLVMSEPGPIDQVMRAQQGGRAASDADRVGWLRGMTSALGQRRTPDQTRFVIKLDAWAILQWPLIRQAFPAVPCIFVYRDPVEVLVSQLGHRGYHMVPGTLPLCSLGLSSSQLPAMAPEQYGAAVLAGLCKAALRAAGEDAMRLVHYDSLPDAFPEIVAPLFGVDIASSETANLARVAERDAKNPLLPFVPDTLHKQGRASALVRAAIEATVDPLYAALETQRLARS